MNSSKKNKSGILDTVKTIIIAGVIALTFRSLVAEPFNIPSGSMIPTLLVGDYLFVSKFSYGYSKYSFPYAFVPFKGRLFKKELQRGDVAVFRLPSDTSIDYIKRVVGLPGDKIQIKQGILFINDIAVKREKINTGFYFYSFPTTLYREKLSTGKSYNINEINNLQIFDNTDVFLVPENHYFMMGDNRDNSKDSRSSDVGFIPYENFIGKALFLFFSHNDSSRIWEIWKWPFAIRYNRIFKVIT